MRLLEHGLSVKAVAAQLGFKWPTNFTKSFSRQVGCSPTDWIEQQGSRVSKRARVANVESLLATGEYKLVDIARIVGFNSAQALSMAFKATHGISPTEWTSRHRGAVPIQDVAVPLVARKKRKS